MRGLGRPAALSTLRILKYAKPQKIKPNQQLNNDDMTDSTVLVSISDVSVAY